MEVAFKSPNVSLGKDVSRNNAGSLSHVVNGRNLSKLHF